MVTRRIAALSLALAIVCFGCDARTQSSTSSQSPSAKKTVRILVAKRSIPNWKPLQLDDIEWRECDALKAPIDAIRLGEPELPWGDLRWVKDHLRYPVYKGHHIRRNDVSRGDLSHDFGMATGYQVFAVRANTADPYVQSLTYEDRVEIEVEISDPDQLQRLGKQRRYRRTILENVAIFRIEKGLNHTTLHLLVRPEQSERLLLARQLGKVSVVSPIRPGSTELTKSRGKIAEPPKVEPTQTISVRTHPRVD